MSIKRIDIPPPPAEVLEIYTQMPKTLRCLWRRFAEKVADSCGYCPDMTAEFSDLSVGVFEGQTDLNTMIIRTDAGGRVGSPRRRETVT